MDTFLWWSGLAFWLMWSVIGIAVLADYVMDILVSWIWTKREFLAFVADRLKKRNPSIPGG